MSPSKQGEQPLRNKFGIAFVAIGPIAFGMVGLAPAFGYTPAAAFTSPAPQGRGQQNRDIVNVNYSCCYERPYAERCAQNEGK